MAWRKAKNGNKCNCCSSSSSSSSGSGSGSGSFSFSSSSSGSSRSSDSSSSSSSGSSSGPLGKCCSIPKEYVIIDETYGPTEFEDMKDWVRSQREGREGVGLIFIGPVELRNGDWYGAVVCMGEEAGGGCDCADIEDGWQCSEGIDALSCYLDAGIPGTGIFEEGGDCEGDEDNPACPNPFSECETGCNGCNCCAAEAPAPGPDGVACSLFRMVVPWEILSYHYGEYIHDPDCQDGKMGELFDYLATRGFERDGLKVATFRTNDDPKDCRVEIWTIPPADANCPPTGAGCPDVCFDGDEDPAWPGITAIPCCPPNGCPPLKCFKPDDIEVDVMDEWQAGQIGGEWKNPAIDGDCPQACWALGACCTQVAGIQDGEFHFNSLSDAASFAEGQGNAYTVYFPGYGAGATGPDDVVVETFLWEDERGEPLYNCEYKYDQECPEEGPVVESWEKPEDNDFGMYQQFASIGIGFVPEKDCSEVDCSNIEDEINLFVNESKKAKAKENPKKAKAKNVETRALPAGPGTELKKLLKIFGLPDRPGCKCNKRAKTMDSWGPDKCSEPERLTEIIGWLKEEAVKQKVPFVEWAARVIVKRAIRNARKAK